MMHTNMGQILGMIYRYDAHKYGADIKHAIHI